jgi:glycerol-3-phosphate O-acyltransferase
MTTEVEHLAAKLTENLLRTTTFSSMEMVVATAALYLKTHSMDTEQDTAEFSELVSGAMQRYQSGGLEAMLDRRNAQLREEIKELRRLEIKELRRLSGAGPAFDQLQGEP